jgi:hypothetical protein
MELPQYITVEEVRRVCKELDIRDWTQLTEPKILPEEAKVILAEIDTEEMDIPFESFCDGLEVELEHGIRFKEANVTNNHPILTGKIVLAHFKESLDYYKRLEVAELESDLLKAVAARDLTSVDALYRKLARAKLALSQAESDQLT